MTQPTESSQETQHTKMEKRTKQLIMRISADEHRKIKEEAARRSITMTKLIMQSLVYFCEKFNK